MRAFVRYAFHHYFWHDLWHYFWRSPKRVLENLVV